MRSESTTEGREGPAIVVGNSRGLGAALTEQLLEGAVPWVGGIARTAVEDIKGFARWSESGRYHHCTGDIALPSCVEALAAFVPTMPPGPLTVIFNASCIDADVVADHSIDFPTFSQVNRVGIDGFGHMLQAVERQLLERRGTLVAISSINALMPPVVEPRLAYAPTKAYLHMAMRCLATLWEPRVRLVTVHLGRIEDSPGKNVLGLSKPSYREAARFIVRNIRREARSQELFFPWPYRLAYPLLWRFLPDAVYVRLLRFLLGCS